MKAFTLIEILLTLSIIIFVILVIFFLTINLTNFNSYFIFNLGKQREIIIGATMMAKELRSMASSNIGNYPLEKILPSEIIFYSDFDNDNLVERIRYFVIEENGLKILKKGVIKPEGNPLQYDPNKETNFTLVTNLVNNNIFSYYNKDYQETDDILVVKIIKINLVAKENNKSILNYSFVIAPRNLRFK